MPTVVGLAHRRTVEQASLSSGNTQSRRDVTIETTRGHEMICALLTALPEPSGTQSSSRFSRWYFSAALITYHRQPSAFCTAARAHEAKTSRAIQRQQGAPREAFRPVPLMHHHRSLLLQAFDLGQMTEVEPDSTTSTTTRENTSAAGCGPGSFMGWVQSCGSPFCGGQPQVHLARRSIPRGGRSRRPQHRLPAVL